MDYKMVKRKNAPSGELRTVSLPLSVMRYSNLGILKAGSYSHWKIGDIQPFFPPVETLFKTDDLAFVNEYGIKFSDPITQILENDKATILSGKTVEVHRKVTMVLSPFKWMAGEFGTNLSLPTSKHQSDILHTKLQNPNTAAYVGSIISAVLSSSGCQHFPKVYGVFSGVGLSHSINISDDYEELSDRPWFTKNIGKTFELDLSQEMQDMSDFRHTRGDRRILELGDDLVLDGIPNVDPIDDGDAVMSDMKQMFKEEQEEEDKSSNCSSISTSYIFNIESCECSDIESEENMQDDSTSVGFAFAKFKNVPVQVTAMEKCEGTLFKLMVQHNETEKHLAWLTQVIFALAYAQRNFGFTHNDLHSNNIMYVKTETEFFYYSHNGVFYKVPTYGYLIKIIDFDRAIASIKLSGMKEAKLFMSDQFAVSEEAGGQYNYGMFHHSKYPEIKPNPSFDLSRLATSLFWDLFPLGPKNQDYSENIVFQMLMRWLTLEDGTSVFFGREHPTHERFHGFHLYKAIARLCKDNAIPRKEISNLKMFSIANVPVNESYLFIDV